MKELPDDLKSQITVYFAESVTRYLELALEPKEDLAFKRDQMLEFANKRDSVDVEAKL